MEALITFFYLASLLYLFLFSLGQLNLTWIYIKKKSIDRTTPVNAEPFEPKITIQLPIYNEKYVVERLIDAVIALKYPKDKLEIQILDDSTDETTGIIYQKLNWLEKKDLDIKHITRKQRQGFKAGALDFGLQSAQGDFIVIFDADFIPDPAFLKQTLFHFQNPMIGAIQTRWGHINKNYSFLTQLQAFGLDAHFSIEQSARNAVGSFINFNGTCGLWRKSCIVEAGGWSADTLTEDLDLSYRAQLKGWKFKYLEEIVTPGELPVVMQAIKSQQYRWNKGGAETAKKLFLSVLRSDIKLTAKIHAFFHLFNSSVFIALLIASVLSIPMLFIKNKTPGITNLFNLSSIFFIGFLSISVFYWVATIRFHKNPTRKFFSLFPGFLTVSMGLCLHNGLAVIEGLLGRKTIFVRTPKFNITDKKNKLKENSYFSPSINLITILEGVLCLYFIFGIIAGLRMDDNTLIFFHSMLAVGFGIVFYFSIRPMTHA
jgi:cellulose synthase/poly-beta-1,6-N-acetylglucosamine synthase-like glycosyltransferase